jgi:heavy metal sensor kinase
LRLPIKIRLTAWYVGLLALVLAALGAFVVVRLRSDLTADIDHSLSAGGLQIKRAYERGGRAEFYDVSETVLRAVPQADSGSQLLRPDGRIALAYGADIPRSPLISPTTTRAVLRGGRYTGTVHGPGDPERFRVYAVRGGSASKPRVVAVGGSLETVDASVHRVIVLLLIALPAALLAVAAGGWWLARTALRPVARMTAQADRIEVDSLDDRVPVPSTSDEIARLGKTLNRMLDRLHEGVDEKRRLVADASHELRTPLAVMRSELDVALRERDLEPSARAVLESTREEVGQMTRIVANLLTLARADEGKLELLRRPIHLREVVDRVAVELDPMAQARRVRLLTEGGDEVVEADADRLRQLVSNLADNAVKHSPPGADVRMEVWRDNGEVGLTVSDRGAGIAAADLPRVFDRFYRADTARARDRAGSGLGLAICQEIARAHGGRLWAESEQGRGSSFSLALPPHLPLRRPFLGSLVDDEGGPSC